MKKIHPFTRDMIIAVTIELIIFYLIYKFFPMQPPELKGY